MYKKKKKESQFQNNRYKYYFEHRDEISYVNRRYNLPQDKAASFDIDTEKETSVVPRQNFLSAYYAYHASVNGHETGIRICFNKMCEY